MRCAVGAVLLVSVLSVWSTGAAQADPLAVPYDDPIGSIVGPELLDPNASPPGANDWSCRPTPEHPEPVILVHGTGTNGYQSMGVMSAAVANEGYCVFSLDYGRLPNAPYPLTLMGGLGDFDTSLAQLADFVDQVLETTGAHRVSFVGHSQGTLIPALYIKFGDSEGKVATNVSIGPALGGSPIRLVEPLSTVGVGPDFLDAVAPLCEACFGTDPGSPLMKRFHDGGPYVGGVRYTNIASRYDPLAPPSTSLIPGQDVTNIVLQDLCRNDLSEHVSMIVSPVVAQLTLDALDPDRQQPIVCV